MCIRDRGCKRPTLYSGSGLYLFHNNWRSFQDGCRDEHGWQSARILRAETLQTRNFRRYQLACVPGPCGFQGICLCATTRMSTTLQMNNNCGTSTVFTQSRPRAPVVAQTMGMSTTFSKIWNCAISKGFCTVRTMDTCRYTTTDMSTNLSKNCTCGISTGFCTVKTMDTCRYTTAGMSTKYPRSATVQYPRASARSGPWTLVVTQQRACQQTYPKNCTCGISTGFRAPVVVQQRTCQQPCPRSATVQPPRASAQSGLWPPVVKQQRACPRTGTVESPRDSGLSGQWTPIVAQQ